MRTGYWKNWTMSALSMAGVLAGSTVFAFADITTAVNSVMGIGESAATAFASGFRTIITPIAIAVGMYTIVRMLVASDSKDVSMYRKRLIFCIGILIVAFALPEIVHFMEYIGSQVGSELNAAS